MRSRTLLLFVAAFIAFASTALAAIIRLQEQEEQEFFSASTDLIRECDPKGEYLLSIDYIDLTPDPPKKGETLTIDFKGYLKEQVPEGTTVEVRVKFGVVQLIHKTFDFCEEATKLDEECPIEAGDIQITKSVDLPKEIPPGKYSVEALVKTPESAGNKIVTCLRGTMVFPKN